MSENATPGNVPLSDLLGPVAEARCWEEPRYEKPPRQMFEFVQFDGFRALPPGAHSLYTRAQLDAAVAAERERRAKKPLTAQQLDKLIEAHVGGAELADGEYSAMVLFAAAVERAHGIGA